MHGASVVAHLNQLCEVVLGIHAGGNVTPEKLGHAELLSTHGSGCFSLGAAQWAAGRSFWDVPSECTYAGWDSWQAKIPNL